MLILSTFSSSFYGPMFIFSHRNNNAWHLFFSWGKSKVFFSSSFIITMFWLFIPPPPSLFLCLCLSYLSQFSHDRDSFCSSKSLKSGRGFIYGTTLRLLVQKRVSRFFLFATWILAATMRSRSKRSGDYWCSVDSLLRETWGNFPIHSLLAWLPTTVPKLPIRIAVHSLSALPTSPIVGTW